MRAATCLVMASLLLSIVITSHTYSDYYTQVFCATQIVIDIINKISIGIENAVAL